jgi:hypothetical protein
MFLKGRRLRRARDKAVAAYNPKINQALKNNDTALAKQLRNEKDEAFMMFDVDIDFYESHRVTDDADRLDVELPEAEQQEYWLLEPRHGSVLNSRGRAFMRQRIHEEQKRRFELRARWFQILTPLLAALAGIIGTVTGLVAVLKKH